MAKIPWASDSVSSYRPDKASMFPAEHRSLTPYPAPASTNSKGSAMNSRPSFPRQRVNLDRMALRKLDGAV